MRSIIPANRQEKSQVELKSRTRKISTVKKSKTKSKGSASTIKAAIPVKGISTIVNGQKVGYLVREDHHIRIFSSLCTALEIAKRNRAFEEALANTQTN
jgi:hypothetical protein